MWWLMLARTMQMLWGDDCVAAIVHVLHDDALPVHLTENLGSIEIRRGGMDTPEHAAVGGAKRHRLRAGGSVQEP